ncbi:MULTISPECIES: HNH/ENDO VII family nuclease [unclassified Pseudoalteromonas]|uniref:HNH/ENDO VII family nuclease n=1 Tax=unclassified Pseudoalteromonas TaxID=194690 RepID=UPI001574E4F9|nr:MULTISPECIES: HNH/ENDO VII family nuclease [unclassified Pseudoalteromonas]MBR8841279.1 HNH/ENDO VII family nuclease [Pseudoalteromonas sp. JC3]NSY36061.1 hypothetical protein [Pseudoalteromonas sp. JC28]WJE10687.1 HNH/ENDO VII family nuclease [Pseudoalteromonas sp. JC3]
MMINFELIANQIDVSATQNITLKAGRSHRSVIQSDINLKADNNLTITAPAGSQLIQSQGNITVKGSGSGNLTLANGGSEISIDSSGNVNIFADKLLTLKGKAMTVFDGSMEQDIGGKQSATMPSVPQIAQIAANQRLSLTADGAASLADKTIDLSYFYSDGTPVEDIDYEVVMDNGHIYTGQLSGGTAEVIDVPAGNYTVSYIGEDEEKIISLRQELRTALDQMVAEIRKQADIQERLIDDENLGMQGLIYSGAFLYGLYQQGESIVTGVADLVEGTAGAIYDVGAATFRILGHLATGDVEAMRAELQQIMSTASESINGIVEAFETLVIIAEDEEARTLLANFPARYFNAHSSVERTRMAGRLSFEILLALATFGSGAVVSAIAKSNYFVKATRALEKLTQATKLKRLNYTRSGTTEKVQLDRIRKLDTSIRDVKKINHGPSIRITAEKHRTSSRLNTRQWKHKTMFDGRLVHQRNDLFDINKKDLNGLTNLERMMKGRPPIGFDGEPVNLHHLIQKEPGTIAEVGGKLHSERTKILHIPQYEKRNGAWLKRKNYSFRAHNGRKSTWPSTQFGNIKKTEAEKIFIKWSSEYWKYRAKGF